MGQHHRNGMQLLAKNGELPPAPPQSMVDLQQQALLRGIACPTCRKDGTQTPLWPFPVGGGRACWFCVACLFPKLVALSPAMVPLANLPPVEAPAEEAPDA